MRIGKPSYEIMTDIENTDFLKFIEIAARSCYKSEDKIEEGSDIKMAKMLMRNNHTAMIEHAPNIAVKFTANRGFTHEIVRMRIASFAQTSTRYVNYNRDKFGNEIAVCLPDYIKNLPSEARNVFLDSWKYSQDSYMELVNDYNVAPQIARDVLPIGIEADIIVTTNLREWLHIMNLRTADVAHPIMHELMRPLLKEFQEHIPVIFDGVSYE